MPANITLTLVVSLAFVTSLFVGHLVTKGMNNHIYFQLESSNNVR